MTYELNDGVPSTLAAGDIINCSYSGAEKTLTLPPGVYRIEAYGAAGGYGARSRSYASYCKPGKGGYAKGTVSLAQQTTFYIHVGGKPDDVTSSSSTSRSGGYNGGGSGRYYCGLGGGATHMATSSGLLNTLENDKESVLIVGGGGGGSTAYSASYYGAGGDGGGLEGDAGTYKGSANTTYAGQGGTQTAGGAKATSTSQTYGNAGSFGQGGSVTKAGSSYATSAGGGGWYGGGAAGGNEGGGGGGSSYMRSDLTDTETTSGQRSGNGLLTITVISVGETYKVTTTIVEGTLVSAAEQDVVEGGSVTIKFNGNDGKVLKSMTVDGVSVTPEKVSTPSAEATMELTTNYGTYQTYNLSNAMDGSTSTYFWSSEAQQAGKYIMVTFSDAVTLKKFETYSSNNTDKPGTNNVLQVSSDGSEWTTVGTFNGQATCTFEGLNLTGVKYARIYCTSEVDYWIVVNEITIEAEVPAEEYWAYTIANVSGDTAVNIVFGDEVSSALYVRKDGAWALAKGVYVKSEGVWTQIQPDAVDTTLKYHFGG